MIELGLLSAKLRNDVTMLIECCAVAIKTAWGGGGGGLQRWTKYRNSKGN